MKKSVSNCISTILILSVLGVSPVIVKSISYKTRTIKPVIIDPNINLTFKLAILLPNDTNLQCALYKVLPAIDVAIDTIRNKHPLFRSATFIVTYSDSTSSLGLGPLRAIDILNAKLASVLFGPVSSFMLASVARYSSVRYKVPILSAEGFAADLGNKKEYPMLTRVAGTYKDISVVFHKIFNKFKWKPRNKPTVAVWYIWNKIKDYECNFQVKPIMNMFSKLGIKYIEFNEDLVIMGEKRLRERIVNNIIRLKKNVRLTILCSIRRSYVRDIMLAAHQHGLTNGEFVFFNIDLSANQVVGHRPWYSNVPGEEDNNKKAKEAYRSVIIITSRLPESEKYNEFTLKVQKKSTMFYQYRYKKSDANSCVGLFHDAVLLYCYAVRDIWRQNKDITDGEIVTKSFRDRSFQGITGDFRIDDNGDGYSDYSLLDMDRITGNFVVVGTLLGKNNSLVINRKIDWANKENKPPPDIPACGFDNSECEKIESPLLISLIILVVLILAIIFLVIVYLKRRQHDALKYMDWKVPWSEIETSQMIHRRKSVKNLENPFYPKENSKKFPKRASVKGFRKTKKLKSPERPRKYNSEADGLLQSNSRKTPNNCKNNHSDDDNISICSNESLITYKPKVPSSKDNFEIARYKGNIVALKKLTISNISVTKKDLMDIKSVKDLNNNHIARFIGICVDERHPCILTEFCPKGSLLDLLENSEFKLDYMLRVYLIQDMCRGMFYLQEGLGYHGNLKSSNCLIDSRLVLKITDFGLASFRRKKTENESEFTRCKNLLWTAPEILRKSDIPLLTRAKSDVYSFAIVCQEIIYRSGVFFRGSGVVIDPIQVIEKVKMGEKEPYRPLLEEIKDIPKEIIELVRKCWEEDPNLRPTFARIKAILRGLNTDADLVDNMSMRLQKYATDLEGLVEEKTRSYTNLLYSMLPTSVAQQLMRGEAVKAESFDSVTIYFSDICGFTELSAESTAMEIVELLNKLYTEFDGILENFDCYKVETIGDAYMVVSGLPKTNGTKHAREIANVALRILMEIYNFKIPHRPDRQLMIRIGIHTGMVCAGVVGTKMPRYCLFGDTVNTSSRMESNGEPLRIHISKTTMEVLKDHYPEYVMESRGEIDIKGKGKQTTYWLLGTKDNMVDKNKPCFNIE